jgi:hypothetical protein
MVAEALTETTTRAQAIARLQETMKNRRTVLQSLEFAARVNREIGLGSDDRPPGVTITFVSNLQPGALRRRQATEQPPPGPQAKGQGGMTEHCDGEAP